MAKIEFAFAGASEGTLRFCSALLSYFMSEYDIRNRQMKIWNQSLRLLFLAGIISLWVGCQDPQEDQHAAIESILQLHTDRYCERKELITCDKNGWVIQLDLTGSKLTSLPKEIGQLTHLKQLNLQSNLLTSLPKEIGQLAQLKVLNLGDNQLTSLPNEIGQLAQLTWLTLGYNQFASWPKQIGQLTQLTWLDLSNNQLTGGIPPEFENLTHLTSFSVARNRLTNTMLPPKLTGSVAYYFSEGQRP